MKEHGLPLRPNVLGGERDHTTSRIRLSICDRPSAGSGTVSVGTVTKENDNRENP
jgi:hypothetical protein